VTKKEIVKTICDRANKKKLIPKHNLTQLATKEIVQWTFEAIVATLVKEGRIELRNFGVFEVKQRKPRKARNPRTGERVDVEAKNVVTFQPGKYMEEEVRKLAKPAEQKKKKPRKVKGPKVVEPAHAPMSNGTAPAPDGTAIPAVPAPAATKPTSEPVTSDAPAAT
jgi:integration host factor subunit beta